MNWKATIAAAALASAAAFAQSACATTVLSDNFNSDGPAGNSTLNWAGDSVFTSPLSYSGYTGHPTGTGTTTNASTDLVGGSSYGFLCQTGQGNCVDLDGTATNGVGNDPAGVLQSIASFSAGTYTLDFDLAGNQRGAPAQTTDVYIGNQLVDSITLASGAAWQTYGVTFVTSGGMLAFVEVGPSDDQGNMLDNVALSTGTPEPATWALLMAGFAGLGVMLRRRRAFSIA